MKTTEEYVQYMLDSFLLDPANSNFQLGYKAALEDVMQFIREIKCKGCNPEPIGHPPQTDDPKLPLFPEDNLCGNE